MTSNADQIISKLDLDKSLYYQEHVIKLIDNPFQGVWTTVFSHHTDQEREPSIFSCLAEPRLKAEILSGINWLKHADSFAPGFCGNAAEVSYSDGQNDGFYFLVAEQCFYQMERSQFILNQEFILFFNLFRGDDGNYYAIDKSGERDLVVAFGGDVRIRTNYLMRYIAAKQVLFVQFIDGRIASAAHYPMNAEMICEDDRASDHYRYKRWFNSVPGEDYLLSMLYARSIVEPQARESCGVWPYEREETFPEFPIAEQSNGALERFSCDPDGLNNYFDSNPDAPMYLTPVFFKPEVLDRYRKNPCFKVTERQLECGSQWAVEIDHVIPSRVMVYLGDLGRDLPDCERGHFLEYAISPTGQVISQEAFANDILNMCVMPTGPISRLVFAREKLNETWEKVFGGHLYRGLHPDDADIEKTMRIPASNSREEFDTVVLNLDRYLVEYIDESQFHDSSQNGSINKLEERLQKLGRGVDITPMRDLHSLRSSSSAHAKGKNYEREKAKLLSGDSAADIEKLVNRLTAMLNKMTSVLVICAVSDANCE